MKAETPCLAQMRDVYETTGGNVIAVEECDPAQTHHYGIIGQGAANGGGFEITSMVEKPKPEEAPSNLFINGRYILQPEIFSILETQTTGAGGEIQLTDAMVTLMQSQPFHGVRFRGTSFDCGAKVGFLAANVAFALDREDIAPEFRAVLADLLA